jgi:hypothetical protein
MTFQSVVQPRMVTADESFTVVLETMIGTHGSGWGYEGWENTFPYLGICLPQGWTIPNDRITCTGAYGASIRYDAALSLEQEAVSPAPAGYVWWVGRGDVEAESVGSVAIDIHIQTNGQVGLFSLDYMSGNARDGVNQQRSNGHTIEVGGHARSPGGLQATVEEESVHLTWRAPHNIEGLVGYVIYRDETVISSSFLAETSYVEPAPSGGLHRYKVAAFYSDGEVYFTASVECYVFLRAGGSGTARDPYLIATARQLMALDQHPSLMDQHFQLISDIDLDPNLPGRRIFPRAVISPDISETQEDFQGTPFTGTFDGNGHTISNLAIEGDSYLGLFGALGRGAQVMDVNIVNADVTGNGWHIGAIAGTNGGTVQDCYSSGLVTGYSDVGGLVGSNYLGYITNSCSDTDVVGIEYVGGLVGSSNEAAVYSSNAMGSVFGWHWVGGLVGFNQGTVSKCSSSSFINGSSFLGGLVGYNGSPGVLSNCHSNGTVLGDDTLGGLVGGNAGTVSFTYSVGKVMGMSGMGGLVGKTYPQAQVVASFWDIDASGQPSSDGGMGLTTVELQDVNTYVGAGWDFAAETDNGTENIWYLAKEGYARFFSFEGVGTSEDPYLVDTVWHLASIGSDPDMLDKHFKLTQPIDLDPNQLGSRVFAHAVIAPDVNLSNDDYDGIPFSGTFDGCGYEIRNMRIIGTNHLGLFGWIGSEAQVSNLSVVSAYVEVEEDAREGSGGQGLLAGTNAGEVQMCHTAGSMSGRKNPMGGLIGCNLGNVGHCTSSADVQGLYIVGGLVGDHGEGQVTDCYSTGTVEQEFSYGSAGGGGLIGINYAYVGRCYATGEVNGRSNVGGLVGMNRGTAEQCYGTGPVTGNERTGGLVGRNSGGAISECYSIGAVTGDWDVGGLVGSSLSGRTIRSFWDVETSGQSRSAGGLGLSTAQMQDINTYLNAGWDFFTQEIWIMNLYPVHYPVQIPGQGTEANPYLISNDNAFVVLRNTKESSSEHYRLTEDIDLASIEFSGPVFPRFSGTFDGGGYAICNLVLTGNRDLMLPGSGLPAIGMFGVVESDARIMNLSVVDASVWVTGDNVAVLAGVNEGHIVRCSTTGSVSGGQGKHFAGLVGRNFNRIEQCFSNCAISHDGDGGGVGGLTGRNSGTISCCYSAGVINKLAAHCGGLTGFNSGTIVNSYSTTRVGDRDRRMGGLVQSGAAGEVHNCFWDIEASGQSGSAGGIGKTTAEMQTASTFLEAGWDFVDEIENGTEDIWWILEGQDYPRLWWELTPEN